MSITIKKIIKSENTPEFSSIIQLLCIDYVQLNKFFWRFSVTGSHICVCIDDSEYTCRQSTANVM